MNTFPRIVALAVLTVVTACSDGAPRPTAAPVPEASATRGDVVPAPSTTPTTRRPAAPSPASASTGAEGGITLEQAEENDVRHAGHAVGVTGPFRSRVSAGDTAELRYVVTNRGSRDDTYTVVAAGGRGTYPVTPREVVVRAGRSAPVTVRVEVPRGTRAGTYDEISVVVRSDADSGVEDEVTTTVEAG